MRKRRFPKRLPVSACVEESTKLSIYQRKSELSRFFSFTPWAFAFLSYELGTLSLNSFLLRSAQSSSPAPKKGLLCPVQRVVPMSHNTPLFYGSL